MPQDYDQTLNLPKTDFPMRAGLPQREPKVLEQWENDRLYYKMVEHSRGKPHYVFHDGPPYANAEIHLGTALNKVLKDFIVRYKNMRGFQTAYVPGWDTHGLPIELKAIRQAGPQITSDPVELRRHCKEFALFHVENQMKQFKRLGTLADYDNPYLTLKPAYEAKQIQIFGEMAKKGYIYKDLKSVYWCPECVTALAEAEIEYATDSCDSLYVMFQAVEDNGTLEKMGADPSRTYFVIWTTTTWTLPANLAICLGPDFVYCAVKTQGRFLVMAKDLVESTMKTAEIDDYEILGECTGKELEYIKYQHPFLDRVSPVIVGDHVTLEAGTGCVHTAPGHGVEDFEVCAKHYPEVGVVVPVDDHGRMTVEAGGFVEGKTTAEANPLIEAKLRESGNVLAKQHMEHQYPHCWRCKEPILFRATEQWFCSVEDFKDETIAAIDNVTFYPDWGRERMTAMVRDRNAWCISRQRTWGVPIPVFYCEDCGEYVINDASIQAVSGLFEQEGADAWYLKDASQILPDGFSCPHCGAKRFRKETDIMDVWFDSGVSHTAVLEGWPDQSWPADLYLEGTDQFRGWFQSSLLTSVAWRGCAPYRAVCSHGWVVDGEGRKMSKSLGNGIDPGEIIKEYGADILRLWVSSSDYHADIRISKDILKQLSEVYRKIRNTARYILGNISDFNPGQDSVPDSALTDLDKWAIARLSAVAEKVTDAYDRFEFHIAYHTLHNFCTVDLSNFYLDIIKDRLYTEKADSVLRRAAQTAMHRIIRTLTLLLAPIIPFTAEEIWSFLPSCDGYQKESVMFNEITLPKSPVDEAFLQNWEKLIEVRTEVNRALETARTEKVIGKSLEAKIGLTCSQEMFAFLSDRSADLAAIFIVSQVELKQGDTGDTEIIVNVLPADGGKCVRCWCSSVTVGQNTQHPALCDRCCTVMKEDQ